jgi:hypothetical protein
VSEIGLLTKTESGPHECEFGQARQEREENRNKSDILEREEEFSVDTTNET